MTNKCINEICPMFDQELESELVSPICESCGQELSLVIEEEEEEGEEEPINVYQSPST